ncbi:trimeric intracellular cation channel family protein [Antrihabitans cavernicola]|uniref:Trimeric intracellular cation channel family protein n=1 Tax=Antrihabitans cavernicola TaxID=2495913 RepID=A0A5A7SHT7_9NOCA|nr:trimeric intracellular cation channel family protein [Spelaeibacter cavernicola]KAA0023781.1 trimeric intracellular cation channel family protein [Spelaeibacter cavernicola]
MFLQILNLAGIAVFAISGALVGVRNRLDLFGICVVGTTTGIGGGLIRDLLLGVHPPTSMVEWPNVAVPVAMSLIVCFVHAQLDRVWRAVLLFDACGMGLFAATGASIALDHGAGALAAVMIGATAAVGGGVLRDVLVNEVPMLLRRDLYALPALLGAVLVVVCNQLGLATDAALLVGALTATGLRCLALWQHWQLPQARVSDSSRKGR